MSVFRPANAMEAAEVIAEAARKDSPLEVVSGGSKRMVGRPLRGEHVLDLTRLSGIVDYDPAELVLTTRAATPLAEVEFLLQSAGQMLSFEPADWRGLLGSRGEPTIGGTVACNVSGPRRVRAGAARDFLLGVQAINGRGEAWKAGGRVVKNVTGYDLSRLQAGSYGTLSAMTELTLKVMPRPETSCTLVLPALADGAAIQALARLLGAPLEVSGAAHLPASAAKRCSAAEIAESAAAATVIRLEGPAPSVAYRTRAVAGLVGGSQLDERTSMQLWSEIKMVHPLLPTADRVVWRVCPVPSSAPAVAAAIFERLPSAEYFYDWGGGLIWLSIAAVDAGGDAAAGTVREALKPSGGIATLIVAPEAIRAVIPVFEPLEPPLAELSHRVKLALDPLRILNPGRMYEGL